MEGSQHNSEKEEGELSSDDDYQSKLSEMQTYIPFLQQMIQRLELSNDRSREAQLSKMKSLYGILSNTKKKLKVETLKKCEDVLSNLRNKVEKSTGHKEGGKFKKKVHRESLHSAKCTVASDSSNSSPNEQVTSRFKHASESDDSRVCEKMSDHEAVVSSTTQSCDSENPVTDMVKALKLAAARNNLRNKLENVKTATHSPGHSDDNKGNVSSSCPSHLVSSSSPKKQNFLEKSDCHTKEGLEQSRERLKKLMGHHLTATPSPPYQSPNEVHSRSYERSSVDAVSPKTEWLYTKDNSWEQYSGAHSIGSDSCDGELFTRRDGRHMEKSRNIVQNTCYNTFHDDVSNTESKVRTFEKSPKSDTHRKSPPRSMKPHLPSSPLPSTKMFSPERGDDSDKSDGGSGARSVRAKLEQEIHKVHRIGVSTGGALRGLVGKDDRNRPLGKGKSDDEKSSRSVKSLESFERTSLGSDRQSREQHNKLDEQPVDPRMWQSSDRSPSPLRSNSSGVKSRSDNTHSKRKSSTKLGKCDNIGGRRDGKEGAEMFSGMSHEELKRIVSENLRNLPSPPPITKEILETVKISPKGISNPSWKSFPQPSKLPSTPASPDEVFHPTTYLQQDAYYGSQQPLGRQGLMEDSMHKVENCQVVDDSRVNLPHGNNENTMHNVYGSQCDERQSVIHHDFDRTGFTNSQNLESMRISGSQHMGEDPRSVVKVRGLEVSRDRSNDNPRYKVPLLEDPRSVYNHGVDDPRAHVPHSYRDDSRRDHHRKIDDSRIGGERRRGLLPTPPRYEKFNYRGPTANSRSHVQDISSRFDQRTHLNDSRGNLLLSPERQNWDASHWTNKAVYPQSQNVDRYQQQMYQTRDSRGQMSITPEEQFSPTGHSQTYQWTSGDGHNTQQTVHSNFITGYQPQPRVDHGSDHSQSKTRIQIADPRLHKAEHPEVAPEIRSGDPRLSHSDSRHSTQYSATRQPLVTGITRHTSVSERDPRRRSIDEADIRKPVQDQDDKKKRQTESWRSTYTINRSETFKKNVNDRDRKRTNSTEQTRSREDDNKNTCKKDSKPICSPLDCLYGTTAIAKTGKGYGFQNFRIPKIKRDIPVRPRPPTPPRPAPPKEKFDENDDENLQATEHCSNERENEIGTKESKERDSQSREVTQELIEALIRKSFESGEGKKLFEHAKFFETLSLSLKNKKLRKIKRILESDSDDSDSDIDKASKAQNKEEKGLLKSESEKLSKTKEPVTVVSDSDDEPLAEKLGIKLKNATSNAIIVSDKAEDANISSENQETSKELEGIVSKDINKDIDQPGSEVTKRIKKPAAKRRNSLELLQQDVRDMFIHEGVVTATGYRMCRLLKEVQSGASLEEISKNEAKRMEDEAEGESDSSLIVGKNYKKAKGKVKSSKKLTSGFKAGKKVTKNNTDLLSDIEAPVVFACYKKRSKRNRQIIEDSDSDSSVSTLSRTSRSKTSGTHSESDRELVRRRRVPRIILEKTDLSKYRSSLLRGHIDSEEESTDEMFNETETRKKNTLRQCYVKKKEGKKGGRKLLDEEDDEFFNREPYMFKRKKLKKSKSFLGKKINDYIPKLHKFGIPKVSLAELFCVDKSSSEIVPLSENTDNIGRNNTYYTSDDPGISASVADFNNAKVDEIKDSVSLLDRLQEEKKPCLNVTSRSSYVLEGNISSQVPVLDSDLDTECELSRVMFKEKVLTCDNQGETKNFPSGVLSSKSSIKLSLVKKKGTGQKKKKVSRWQLGIIRKKSAVHKIKYDAEGSIEGCNADANEEKCSVISDSQYENGGAVEYSASALLMERDKEKEEERPGTLGEEIAQKYSVGPTNFTDVDYAFHCEAKQTACLLCSYEGKTIVQHYKQVHPDSEVLISRLPIDEACRATTESEDKGYNESTFKEEILGSRKGPSSFFCRFCNYKAQYAVSFYEHTSSHTGEYRYQCCKCPYMSASRTTFKGHFYSHHPKNKLKQGLNLKVLTEGPSNSAKFIFGFLCSKCNFVQLLHENIQQHISLRHADDKEVKAIRINMSKSTLMEITEISDEAESCIDNSEIVSDEESVVNMDSAKEHSEFTNTEGAKKTAEVIDIKLPPSVTAKEEPKWGSEKSRSKNVNTSQVCEKKPNLLEAFVSISLEVDKDECIILEERVKRTQDVIDKVNLNNVLTDLQYISGEDDDIVIVLESKLRTIKQEVVEMKASEFENVSSNPECMNDDSDVNIFAVVKNEKNVKEQISDIPSKTEYSKPEMLKGISDNVNTDAIGNAEVIGEGDTQTPIDLDFEKESMMLVSSDAEMQDTSLEKKTKSILKRTSATVAEPNKLRSLTCKLSNCDELNERRVTRSLSKTDDDGRSVLSDDSGCDASNFEVIEITDESDLEEEELDMESVLTNAKSVQKDADEGVSLHTGNLIERLTKHIVSKDSMCSVIKTTTVCTEMEESNASLKPPPLAASLNKCIEEKKAVVKQSAVVNVACLEARLCLDQSVLFSCLVPCCVFTTVDASLMEKHLARSHKPNWWDGVCSMCDKRVYGDDFLKGSPMEHKYPLSFALDHLRTVHLDNLLLCDDLQEGETAILPLAVAECTSVPVTSSSSESHLADKSHVGGEDNQSLLGSCLAEVEGADFNETKAPCQYIRMRRLSGDKLSGPAAQSKVSGTSDTSCDSIASEVPESDSNILTNEGGGDNDDELPFLKIESVVSLHPSAGSNVKDTFIDRSVSDSPLSSPVAETSNSPLSSSFMEKNKSPSNLLQQPIVAYAHKLVAVPGNSPVKKQLQLVPVSPTTRGTIAVVPNILPSTNIPQPLVNLAQLIRPGTRVVVSKESSSVTAAPVQFVPSRTNAMLLSGSNALPNILPKPVASTFINIITSPGKSTTPSAVVIPQNLVASTSLSSPGVVLPPTTASNAAMFTSVSFVQRLRPVSGCTISLAQKQEKSSAVFVSGSSARTSYFPYKRQEQQRPPMKNTRQKLSHKMCKTFEQAKASKTTSVYQRMLIHDKLRQLFKCMAKHCNFTSDSPKHFEDHCWKHVHLYKKLKLIDANSTEEIESVPADLKAEESELVDIRKIESGAWPQCAYCCTLHDTPQALNTHMQEEHGQCVYQCAYCFFRAVAYSYVVLHQNTNHTNMRITVLLCRKIPKLLPPVSVKFPRKDVVLPYVCNQGTCGLTFWNPAAFWRHLESSHANMTYYFCHLCVGQYVKPEKLLAHYKLHCHCYYQCQYCLHGSDTKEDMHHHLCNFHPNQKAIVIMRDSDPNMPATGSEMEKSVDYLKVIDLDVGHREESLIFPPVPSIEYSEFSKEFWKSYKAFADENPSINTSDDNLLSPEPMKEGVLRALRASSKSAIVNTETPVASMQIVSKNSDETSEMDSTDIDILDQTSDSTDSSVVDTADNINTTISYSDVDLPTNKTSNPTDASNIDADIALLDSSSTLDKNMSSGTNKNDNCEVIVIDDSSDVEELCESLDRKDKETLPLSQSKLPLNNEDSDSDVMIIGSDEEAIPSKRQKIDFSIPLQESDPNYEPVVTLRHRNLESKARIESAVDPLAPDLPEKQDDVHSGSSGGISDNILGICPSDRPSETCLSESNVLLSDDSENMICRTGKDNMPFQKLKNSNCEEAETKVLSSDIEKSKQQDQEQDHEQQQQQQQQQHQPQQNAMEKSKLESSKDLIDPDILAQSVISQEELEKTGASGERLYRCGNITCSYAASTSNLLRDHLLLCDLSRESAGLTCVHCQRPFKQITPYMEHLKHHGTCRYNCFMCKFRAPLPQQVIKHLKQKHRIYNSIVLPVNQQNTDPEIDLFVVCSKDKTRPKLVPHFRKKRIFTPDEVGFLPLKYISYHPLTCSVCNFRSKVVSNMRRHLNFHNNKMELDDIPLCDPVNPVPHLEKKEMMFDKMTNLAASSHPLGRMGGKPMSGTSTGGPLEQIILPKFVPEHERYVCGSPGCNYLTCDESMLRYHMRALHCDETSYRCPHCPENMQRDLNGMAISVDRMGAHLKMHDSRLYKCTHCVYFHFQRHIVERHLSDKHPEKRPFVQVVREEGEVPNVAKPEESSLTGERSSLQSNPLVWMCGLCKMQFASRNEVYEHAATSHNIKSQYRCSLCTFRSSSKPNCENHFYSRHPGLELDLITVCRRVDCDSVDVQSTTNSNTSTALELPSKRFDTTPLWLRNMVRVRHIRGVLIEDEEETRLHMQKVDETLSTKKMKVKECTPTPSSSRAATPEPEELDHLEQKFAPYGKPALGNLFFCTLCNKYKTRFKADMKDHLYRELNYVKWMCEHCNLTSCSKHQIQKHSKVHEKESKPESIIALQPDNDTELWVERLLTKQHNNMKGIHDISIKQTSSTFNKGKNSPSSTSTTSGTAVLSTKTMSPTPNNKVGSPLKVMDTRDVSGNSDEDISIAMRHSSQKRKLVSMVRRDLEDFEESQLKKISLPREQLDEGKILDSRDVYNDEYGQKDKPPMREKQPIVTPSTAPSESATVEKKYKCKDCKSVFSVARGLKIHVRLAHLRLGSYSCGYCDRSAYSEMAIKQHCKSQHADQPELIIYNKSASNIKLDDEFWEKEYGIKPKCDEFPTSKKQHKVSGQSSLQNTTNSSTFGSESPSLPPTQSAAVSSQVKPLSTHLPSKSTNSQSTPASCATPEGVSSATSASTSLAVPNSSDVSGVVKDQEASEETDEIILIDEISRKCAHCEYRCKSSTDLRNHEMRHWVEKPFKCGHCDFEAVREYEVKKHSAKVHPTKKVRVIQKHLPSTPEIKPLQRPRKPTLNPVNKVGVAEKDEAKNLELTDPSLESAVSVPEEISSEDRKVFRCFYCPLRATSLGIVHKHWEKMHKGRIMSATGVSKNGLPFRYKEVSMNDLLKGRLTTRKKKSITYTCPYCNKKGTYSIIMLHHKEAHPDKPVKLLKFVTQYECAECQLVSLASGTLKRHFELEHPEKEFRYMVRTTSLPVEISNTDLPPSGEDGESSTKAIDFSSPGDQLAASCTPSEVKLTSKENLVKYICGWCSETCSSEVKMNFHHTMYHSHLEQKFSVESTTESVVPAKSIIKITQFKCPKCSFKVPSFEKMCEHLRKHCRPFKCGYCGRLFELPFHVRNHISVLHSNKPPKIISVKDDLSALKAQVISTEEEIDSSQYTEIDLTEKVVSCDESEVPRKKKMLYGFARKSTSMKQRILPVARKSTNPTPYRYSKREEETLPSSESGNSRPNSPSLLEEFSYYGQKVAPLDWKKIRTTVNYGGVYVQVNVANMSQIFNLNPVVLVKDLKTQWNV